MTSAHRKNLLAQVAKCRELAEDNQAGLRFLLNIELRKHGVRGWRKRARLVDEIVAKQREHEYVETRDARIPCDACGEWIYTRRRAAGGPPAFPSVCQGCGAPLPDDRDRPAVVRDQGGNA